MDMNENHPSTRLLGKHASKWNSYGEILTKNDTRNLQSMSTPVDSLNNEESLIRNFKDQITNLKIEAHMNSVNST